MTYSEGILGDGAVILRDGEPVTIEEVVRRLNKSDELHEALHTVVNVWTSQFERNGHLAPEWVKKARSALTNSGPNVKWTS